ncbi:cell envelope integrity protein TolA [bacterium SCSIO 12696]|nr:cell envelope integrity protein TolA [bacterium SCSIO 12696]
MALHAGLIVLVVTKWVPDEPERKIVTPKYIDAKLLQLTEKEKPKPKKDNSAAKRREQERQRKLAEDKRRKEAAEKKRKQQEAEKRRKAEAEKKRKQAEAEKKRQEEAARKKRAEEAQRKALEDDLFSELDEDLEGQIAENDEQVASSYSGFIRRRVSGNWSRPPSARLGMEAEVLIQLVPTGRVVSIRVVKSSGDAAFDRSVEQAIRKADSFPELKNVEARVFEKYFRNLRMVFRPEDLRI